MSDACILSRDVLKLYIGKKYNAKSNKNTSKSKGGYMLFKKKRRQDLPVDREWKEKKIKSI